jgi:hypothetical protein
MCVSRNMGRNSSAPTHTQTTLNEWSQVEDRPHQNRQGYQSTIYSDIDPREHATVEMLILFDKL